MFQSALINNIDTTVANIAQSNTVLTCGFSRFYRN